MTDQTAPQEVQPQAPSQSMPCRSLYQSGWSPRGVRKAWDRCSMDTPSTARMLGSWHERMGSEIVEAVGWFDDDGCTRVLIADYANGRRMDVRLRANGQWRITFAKAEGRS